jgi:signal transduction histidine kinase
VGRLAGGIAHDFNNMLLAIRGYAELIAGQAKEDGAARHAREIVSAADRATVLTRQLLAFGRRQVLAPEVFDLNELPSGIASMLERVVGEIYVIELERGERAPVHADRSQLEQAVVNLVLNARDAMPGGGRITVRTGAVALDDHGARQLGVEPAVYAMLRVSDHGTGIDEATLHHVFEPFFSTKDATKGTGLGLSTVHGVATQSGGAVGVETEPGRGSTFTIYLPLAPTGP